MMKLAKFWTDRHQHSETGLKTEGVMILPSMDAVNDPFFTYDHLEEYRKPGYTMCPFVSGFIQTDVGPIPRVKTSMDKRDVISTVLVRMGIGRHNYKVSPGLKNNRK